MIITYIQTKNRCPIGVKLSFHAHQVPDDKFIIHPRFRLEGKEEIQTKEIIIT